MTQAVQKAEPQTPDKAKPIPTLAQMLMSPGMGSSIAAALPKHVNGDRMARICLTALRATKNLADCDQHSFLACVLQSAQLGLEPNTPLGHAYLIPFRNKNRRRTEPQYECTLILGYQGMIDLAGRSGRVNSITAEVVKAGDHFSFRYGLDPQLEHTPSRESGREEQPVIAAYAIAHIKGAAPVFQVLTLEQINARRKRSKASKDGPWVTDFEAMARKSAVRALWPWIPKSSEMALAVSVDDGAERGSKISQVFDPAIIDALQGQGIEPMPSLGEGDDDDSEPAIPHDPVTGEVIRDPIMEMRKSESSEYQALREELGKVDPEAVARVCDHAPDVESALGELRKMRATLDAARGKAGA